MALVATLTQPLLAMQWVWAAGTRVLRACKSTTQGCLGSRQGCSRTPTRLDLSRLCLVHRGLSCLGDTGGFQPRGAHKLPGKRPSPAWLGPVPAGPAGGWGCWLWWPWGGSGSGRHRTPQCGSACGKGSSLPLSRSRALSITEGLPTKEGRGCWLPGRCRVDVTIIQHRVSRQQRSGLSHQCG